MRTLAKLLVVIAIGLALAKPKPPPRRNGGNGPVPTPPVHGWSSGKAETKENLDQGPAGGADSGDGTGSDQPDGSGSSTDGQTPTTTPNHPDKWADNNLESHYDDHKNDPTAQWETMAEYQYAAIDLMTTDGGRRDGVRIKVSGDGTAYYYDPATGEFGRSGPRGIITFFIPHPDPDAYFARQPGTEVFE